MYHKLCQTYQYSHHQQVYIQNLHMSDAVCFHNTFSTHVLRYAYDIIGTNQETHRFMRVAGWFVLLYYNMII